MTEDNKINTSNIIGENHYYIKDFRSGGMINNVEL